MAVEVYVFAATITAGTPKTALAQVNMTMPARIVDEIEILVPPGPRGEVGFSIGSAGVAVIPRNAGGFIVTDDEVIHWPLEEFWDSGAWQLQGYNTGAFDHTIEVRFLCRLPAALAQAVQAPAISSPADLLSSPLSSPLPGPPSLPPLPGPPSLPPLPGPPSLPPLPIPSAQVGPAPALAVVENDPMRYAELTRPDGTLDVFVLLNDGTIVHWTEKGDTTPNTLDKLPGAWVAMRRPFMYAGELVVRGLGTDANVWQTTFRPGVDTAWSSPVKVLG